MDVDFTKEAENVVEGSLVEPCGDVCPWREKNSDEIVRCSLPKGHEGRHEAGGWNSWVPSDHVIVLKGDLRSNELPEAACTCLWSSGKRSLLIFLGNEAHKHAIETGHTLRPHG